MEFCQSEKVGTLVNQVSEKMFCVGVSVGLLENIGFGDSFFLSTKSMQVKNQMQVVTRKYSASVATTLLSGPLGGRGRPSSEDV